MRSLTSIMATSGDPNLPPPTAEAMAVLMTPAPKSRDEYIANFQRNWKVLRGPEFSGRRGRIASARNASYDRGAEPGGRRAAAARHHRLPAAASRSLLR